MKKYHNVHSTKKALAHGVQQGIGAFGKPPRTQYRTCTKCGAKVALGLRCDCIKMPGLPSKVSGQPDNP